WIGAMAASTLILSAAYTLWMYKRVIFGAIANARVAGLKDLGKREFVLLGAMALLVLAIGLDPKPFTDAIDPSVGTLLAQSERSTRPEPTRRDGGEHLQAAAPAAVVAVTRTPG
ncbi:MAG: NADH-quinone oxidoreductase subunit M, partial [Paraburkholderia graminis]